MKNNIRLNFAKSNLSPEKTLCIKLNDNVIYATAVDDDSVDEGAIIIDDVKYNIDDVVIGAICNSTNEKANIIAERGKCIFGLFGFAASDYFGEFPDRKTCNITGFYIYKNDCESIIKILEHIIADTTQTDVIVVGYSNPNEPIFYNIGKAIVNKMKEHGYHNMHSYDAESRMAFCKYY